MTSDFERFAYCYADGELHFGNKIPKGALVVDRLTDKSKQKKWQRMLEGLCRRTYDDSTFLIPGIPEAADQFAGVDALHRFCQFVRRAKAKL